MSSPSFEAQNGSDKSGSSEETQSHGDPTGTSLGSRSIVVEASFDEGDGRGPLGESNINTRETRTSPLLEKETVDRRRGHVRNLSEHFYDATSLTGEGSPDPRQMTGSSYATSREVGQKHRRGFSGEFSLPAEAHRRINSIGNSASVSRPNYSQDRRHQRVDSGLDILTAVAGASREELAMAAGERGRDERRPWEAPPPSSSSIRRSPVELLSYDHSASRTQEHPPPPTIPISAPPPSREHHAGYPGGHHHHPPPPPSYYGAPPPAYPQHMYPPHQSPHYYPPQPHHYARHLPPHPPRSGYPMQYSRAQSPYKAPYVHHPMAQPTFPRNSPPEPIYSAREATGRESMSPPPPVPSAHWHQPGTTQGSQTVMTTIGVEDGGRTLHPSTKGGRPEKPSRSKHHRKTSSINSLVFLGETAEQMAKEGHHRATSSTVSFLNGVLDVNLEGDAAFLHNLHASGAAPAPPPPPYEARKGVKKVESRSSTPPPPPPPQDTSPTDSLGNSKLAPGGTSKRVRRKCTIEGCPNRVVQGGLCISHGAKRKQCKHPGCNKNVKKAGLCSTHGPARKRCEFQSCNKVAVQGGRCIAHGAKKKLCLIDGCAKQAILAGMCKKHHDHSQGPSDNSIQPPPVDSMAQCVPVDSEPVEREIVPIKTSNRPKNKARGHTRGLSIFQEMTADTVGNLLLEDPEDPSNESGTENQRRVFGMY
ncbi:unnamed protein product [Cylindrotheca closterium]|uniref:WRKY19-like zinc finger domain-containing protein n=1 Tax=Cylindrotheca closterium TaxID=2856 RepID=A0AAD2FSY3_9STRA|nr:unnamed protein product [Cylindrotheca closterium]